MFDQHQLNLLCATLGKCRIPVKQTNADTLADVLLEYECMWGHVSHTEIRTPQHGVRYHYTCAWGACYVYLLLPYRQGERVLCIGPYLPQSLSRRQMLEIGERCGLSVQQQKHLEQTLISLPVLLTDSPIFAMLDAFCEQLWNTSAFTTVNLEHLQAAPAAPIHQSLHHDSSESVLMDMRAMEQRYAFENEMMQAVTDGQMHKESHLFASLATHPFERRATDPVRNAQNYAIIMNTLLRKAAQNGGVHPLYIDRVSSDFAHRIETIKSVGESSAMMLEMFRGYCALVQQHSLGNYSPVVRTAILLIDSDLSANLSLHTLAQSQSISPGYLSTAFKKETGKTVTAYIREKRMRYACFLLSTTNLQVQTVAMHCGILDVHYFSKIFKKEYGQTPLEYREHPVSF